MNYCCSLLDANTEGKVPVIKFGEDGKWIAELLHYLSLINILIKKIIIFLNRFQKSDWIRLSDFIKNNDLNPAVHGLVQRFMEMFIKNMM